MIELTYLDVQDMSVTRHEVSQLVVFCFFFCLSLPPLDPLSLTHCIDGEPTGSNRAEPVVLPNHHKEGGRRRSRRIPLDKRRPVSRRTFSAARPASHSQNIATSVLPKKKKNAVTLVNFRVKNNPMQPHISAKYCMLKQVSYRVFNVIE